MDQPIPRRCADVGQAVSELRNATIADLLDVDWLEHHLLPRLGLNNEHLHEFPAALYPWCGHGLRSWQYPTQFSRYLRHLSKLGVATYAEIGCRHGGTFVVTVEYLKRFGTLSKVAAIDLMESPILRAYAGLQPLDYLVASRLSATVLDYLGQTSWDLVLIDGDHSLQGCLNDYSAVRNSAKRIALHDIASDVCPGVVQAWRLIQTVMPGNRLFEQTQQYNEVRQRTGRNYLGLGIVDFT